MSRNIDSALMAAMTAAHLVPIVFFAAQFRSGWEYAWSGPGPFVWNGQTFKGVGSMGKVGDVTECGESSAQGTSVQLSGVDPAWLGAAMADIRPGAPARLWLGALNLQTVSLIGAPYMFFRGQIDKAPITVDAETCTITLNLESRLINHARPNARRYTTADQHANGYPDDTGFFQVEALNDQALFWAT